MHIIYILMFCVFLAGCGGPKPVGYGTAQAEVTGVGYAVDDPGQLRYPLSGRNIDKKLYFLNQPHNMIQLQQHYKSFLQDKNTMAPPNDYNNLQPREASPFRQ